MNLQNIWNSASQTSQTHHRYITFHWVESQIMIQNLFIICFYDCEWAADQACTQREIRHTEQNTEPKNKEEPGFCMLFTCIPALLSPYFSSPRPRRNPFFFLWIPIIYSEMKPILLPVYLFCCRICSSHHFWQGTKVEKTCGLGRSLSALVVFCGSEVWSQNYK